MLEELLRMKISETLHHDYLLSSYREPTKEKLNKSKIYFRGGGGGGGGGRGGGGVEMSIFEPDSWAIFAWNTQKYAKIN